jgi:methenyltetrahydromethanopterin cyclohydrolase
VTLNARAARLCEDLLRNADTLRVESVTTDGGTRLVDCGISQAGGLEAGRRLAEICLAGLGEVRLVPGSAELWPGTSVMVTTDQPLSACMASQYAGWEVTGEKFFAMGSGPMRAASGREPLFEKIGHTESTDCAVGVLESDKLPPDEVCREIAEKCGVASDRLTLLVAPTHSQAGTLQVVARSVETAMHKLFELDFDLTQIETGVGTAPLPPVAADQLSGIGRTNDAILYGGEVTLEVRGDDRSLVEIGPRVPSSASADYGRPFAEVLAGCDNDFYRVDPLLFSAAKVTFVNLDSGERHTFGEINRTVLERSFKNN